MSLDMGGEFAYKLLFTFLAKKRAKTHANDQPTG